jgi:hypothetical protein
LILPKPPLFGITERDQIKSAYLTVRRVSGLDGEGRRERYGRE